MSKMLGEVFLEETQEITAEENIEITIEMTVMTEAEQV